MENEIVVISDATDEPASEPVTEQIAIIEAIEEAREEGEQAGREEAEQEAAIDSRFTEIHARINALEQRIIDAEFRPEPVIVVAEPEPVAEEASESEAVEPGEPVIAPKRKHPLEFLPKWMVS